MKLTIKELASKINIVEGTIRSWIMKPEQGKVYLGDAVNYGNLREKLHKYFENEVEFEKLVGCKIDEVEIEKVERATKAWTTIENITEAGTLVVLHNYSLQTKLAFVGVYEGLVYIFQTCDGKQSYKAYHKSEFEKDNIKLELIVK